MNVDKIKQAVKLMNEANGLLAAGPLSFYLDEMVACYDLLMTRFSPLKVNDRVVLIKTPEITQEVRPGWLGSKHFVIAGAHGIITEASCGKNGFSYGVIFDNESWLDRDGVRHTVTEKHSFTFGESWLVKLTEENQ